MSSRTAQAGSLNPTVPLQSECSCNAPSPLIATMRFNCPPGSSSSLNPSHPNEDEDEEDDEQETETEGERLLSERRSVCLGRGVLLNPAEVGIPRTTIPMRQNVAIDRRHRAGVGPSVALAMAIGETQHAAALVLAGRVMVQALLVAGHAHDEGRKTNVVRMNILERKQAGGLRNVGGFVE